MRHPYREFEQTPVWHALDAAFRDLEQNGDVALATVRPYVVGYLTRALAASVGGAPGRKTSTRSIHERAS